MAERFRDSAMAMSDFMITIEANSMEAGKSMSQINSYAKSNKNKLCNGIAKPIDTSTGAMKNEAKNLPIQEHLHSFTYI
jgi:hypothetical protein